MAIGNEIGAGAKAIAEDLHLPGGGLKKLARVVEDHLGWFDRVEARGLTWADISRLLFAAGAKGTNGRPFSVGTLYSTGDRQAFRSRKRICRPSEAVGRRTNVRMARAVQASRQRLGESQSQGARISAPRFNQAHAEKTMQSRMISPDRL